jgi:hypothetical protein
VKTTQQDITLAAFEALLAKHGERISPRALLDEARDFNSPFHDFFNWNDDEAAEQYRLIQAGQLLRRWKGSVIRIDNSAKLVSVQSVRRVQSPLGQRARGGTSYEAIESIMADPAKRADMVATVLRELSAYRKRYAQIEALADVWRAIDEANEANAPAEHAAAHAQPSANV